MIPRAAKLFVCIALLVGICGRELIAAPSVNITQIVRSKANAQGSRSTRVSRPGIILGRLSDGRYVAVCGASGRLRGAALIDVDGEKETAGTCVAVNPQLNVAVVLFAHPGSLASSASISQPLQQYLLRLLGEVPTPAEPDRPPGPGPRSPDLLPEPGPRVDPADSKPVPPPHEAPPAPAPVNANVDGPSSAAQFKTGTAYSNLKTDLSNELGKLLNEHKAELLQAVQSAAAENKNGLAGVPAAVESAIGNKVPGILQEGVKDLATKDGLQILQSAPGWLSSLAHTLGFNAVLGAAGGPVGLAATAIAGVFGLGKLLISKFTAKPSSGPPSHAPPSHAPPGQSSSSVPQSAPATVAATTSSAPAQTITPSQAPMTPAPQQTIVPVQVADPWGAAMQQAEVAVLKQNPNISLVQAMPLIQQVAQTILDLQKSISPNPVPTVTLAQ